MQAKIDFIEGNTRRCLMAMALPMIAAMSASPHKNAISSLC